MRFPCLQGLRGVLALWVVLFHTTPGGFGPLHFPRYGALGVDVFFVMSGFVLMQAHHRDFAQVSAKSVGHFWRLRAWRTFPVHILACCIALAISVLAFGHWPGTLALLLSFALVDTWNIPFDHHAINTPIWSLHLEWMGYIAFPWICRLLVGFRPSSPFIAGVAGIVAAEISLLFMLGTTDVLPFTGIGALLRMAGGFGAGCVLWSGFTHPVAAGISGDRWMVVVLLMAFAILMVANEAWALLVIPAGVLAAARPGRATALALDNIFTLFLGRISFSLYLCHYPIVRLFAFFQQHGGQGVLGGLFSAAAILVSIGMATGVCLLVEEPLRRFGRRSAQSLQDSRLPGLAPINRTDGTARVATRQ